MSYKSAKFEFTARKEGELKTQIIPLDVLKTLEISKEQYARMSSREVMDLVRWFYAHQAEILSNLKK